MNNREKACLYLSLCASSSPEGPIGDAWDIALDQDPANNMFYTDDYLNHPARKLEEEAWRVALAAHCGYDDPEQMESGLDPIHPVLRTKDSWRAIYAEAESLLRSGWMPPRNKKNK